MPCTRCGGAVVIEEFLDAKGSSLAFEGQRCLNCGHIEDAVIHSHQGRASFPPFRSAGALGRDRR